MMKFEQLFAEEDAVSPVIGVILMVAITVILAAVIGTFVLGLGDQVQQTAPNANFETDQGTIGLDTDGTDDAGDQEVATINTVSFKHSSGNSIPVQNLEVKVNGNPAYGIDDADTTSPTVGLLWDGSGDVSAGDRVVVALYDTAPDTTPTYDDTTAVTEDDDTTNGLIDGPTDASELTTDDTVSVVWTSDDGSQSSTVAKHTVN